MRIYGVDFTSRPRPAKPIVVAECDVEEGALHVRELLRLTDLDRFEQSLHRPGPWVAGIDFPFSQPRKLLRNLDWPEEWEAVVSRVSTLSKDEFADLLDMYRASRPSGDKEHKRVTDRRAKALSPMKLYGTPVAKMFYEGAPRLHRAGVNVLPCRPTFETRTVVEAYPGLAVRQLIGTRRSYKAEGKRQQTGTRAKNRRAVIAALRGEAVRRIYGFPVEISPYCADTLADDPRGDHLDAVLCAVQAAWAWHRRDEGWGIPDDCDQLEGWIVDPGTVR